MFLTTPTSLYILTRMNTKAEILAEEVLILLCYGFDLLTMPTFRKWADSYEGWLYRNGLLRRMHYLEKQKWLLREGKKSEWVYKLTEAGRQHALGGRDPEAYWRRPWDGWWRQIVFDLPVERRRERKLLIRWFRQHGFGYLQDSVWISPDPVADVIEAIGKYRDNAEAFTILQSHCAPGFTDSSLVGGAWQFGVINEKYRAHMKFAATCLKRCEREQLHPRDLFALLRQERMLWSCAFGLDPLLPIQLWPSDYEGQRAWKVRGELLRALAKHGTRAK